MQDGGPSPAEHSRAEESAGMAARLRSLGDAAVGSASPAGGRMSRAATGRVRRPEDDGAGRSLARGGAAAPTARGGGWAGWADWAPVRASRERSRGAAVPGNRRPGSAGLRWRHGPSARSPASALGRLPPERPRSGGGGHAAPAGG